MLRRNCGDRISQGQLLSFMIPTVSNLLFAGSQVAWNAGIPGDLLPGPSTEDFLKDRILLSLLQSVEREIKGRLCCLYGGHCSMGGSAAQKLCGAQANLVDIGKQIFSKFEQLVQWRFSELAKCELSMCVSIAHRLGDCKSATIVRGT